MRRLLPSAVLLALLATMVSCATTYDYGSSSERYAPAVYIPRDLNDYERRYVHAVEDALSSAGYRISSSRSAEYQLEFSIEAGPVNTDTHLTLYRDGSEVATAYARGSGIFRGDAVVRESFDKCLYEFERQLPRVSRGSGYDRGYDRHDYDSYGYPDRRSSSYDRSRYDSSRDYGYEGY